MSRRNQRAVQARETQHLLWSIRVQELMNEHGCSAPAALQRLRAEVSLDAVPPAHRAAYRTAWTDFLRKVKDAAASRV